MEEKIKRLLERYGEKIVEQIKEKLRREGLYASGNLNRTIYSFVEQNGDDWQIVLEQQGDPSYLGAIDEGARPNPTYQAIVDWLESKRTVIRDEETGRFRKLTPGRIKRAAFNIRNAIAENGIIKRYGYSGSGVVDFVLDRTLPNLEEELADLVEVEIVDLIEKQYINKF